MSRIIQFDGEIDDIDKLKQELKIAGVEILYITRSRWRGQNGEDKGARIDVEIEDDIGDTKPKIDHLELTMKTNKTWKEKVK